MSTVSKYPVRKERRPAREPDDPFRYGWRYVRKTRPDGTEVVDEVPLTLEDVLYPEEDDFVVETIAHNNDRDYLKGVFTVRLESTPNAIVLSNCRVKWNVPGVRALGPDVAVFTGARRRLFGATFDVAREGATPALVVEITSTTTRVNDVGPKVDLYHRAGVPLYAIADVLEENEGERRIELIAYERGPRRYRRIKADKRGRIWLAPVRVWLGLSRASQGGFTRLACFDPDTDQELGDYTAVCHRLAQAEQLRQEAEDRAEAEARARAEAEERIRTLQAELKKSRARK